MPQSRTLSSIGAFLFFQCLLLSPPSQAQVETPGPGAQNDCPLTERRAGGADGTCLPSFFEHGQSLWGPGGFAAAATGFAGTRGVPGHGWLNRRLGHDALMSVQSATSQVSTEDVATEGDCSPIVVGTSGEVTINKDCSSPFSDEELERLREAIARLTEAGEWLEGSPNPLKDRDERLSAPIGISREELAEFLRILKRREGSTQDGAGRPGATSTGDLSTKGDCSPIVVGTSGDVTIDITCPLPLSPKELAQLRETAGKLAEASERLAELPDHLRERYERLSAQFGVTESALATFFRILNEENVPLEELDAKLREIAKRHRQLLIRVAELDAVDEKVAELRDKAKAAIERGDYDAADALLKEAQEAQDAVLAQAEKPFVVAAELRARRADLKATVFHHKEAAELYEEAADLVPGTQPLKKADYLKAAGLNFMRAGFFDLAEGTSRRALKIRDAELGKDHPAVAASLNDVAFIYLMQSRLKEAEPLLERALAIREAKLGKDHLDVARTLNDLAGLYQLQHRNEKAEALYKRALAIMEAKLGKDHPDVALSLNDLAVLYLGQGRHAEAEPLLKRALEIRENRFGKDHPFVARTLANLATVYHRQGRNADAERLLKRALVIAEEKLGKGRIMVARIVDSLAVVYDTQGRRKEAERLYKRALLLFEKRLGKEQPDVAYTLNNLGTLYVSQGRYEEAELAFKRALAIFGKKLGKSHPVLIQPLKNLALLYVLQDRYGEAEPLIKRAFAIAESKLGKDHPTTQNMRTAMEALQKIKREEMQ